MTAAEWLRFAGLSLLGAWVVWRLYRRAPAGRRDAWLPFSVAGIAAAQLVLTGQAATDPFTPLGALLPELLASAYGAASVAVVFLGVAAGVWLLLGTGPGAQRQALTPALSQRERESSALRAASAGVILAVLFAGSSALAQPALADLANSGEIAMSPTLDVPRSALSTSNPYSNDPNSAARGKVVFQQNCAVCHGLDGAGNGPAGANLRIHPPSFHNPQHFLAPGMDGAHFWVIQHGDSHAGGMPAWQGTLTTQQMWDALNYIKTIAAGKPA